MKREYNTDIAVQFWNLESTGTVQSNSMEKFAEKFLSRLTAELMDYGMPTKVRIVDNSTAYAKMLNRYASPENDCFIYLRFKLSHRDKELKCVSRTVVNTSAYDSTLLGSYIIRHFEHWDLDPWHYVSEILPEYEACKRGLIPITITLGAYHTWQELCDTEKSYDRIAYATTRALIHYLWPKYFNPLTPKPPSPLEEANFKATSLKEVPNL